jgi:hypothetical protein
MKRLQHNYTTQEQSKRLLELGVPAWTADCYYTEFGKIEIKNTALDTLYPSCWSVGRLIEVMKICAKPKEQAIMSEELLYCRDLVGMLVFILEGNRSVMDFSKLEE